MGSTNSILVNNTCGSSVISSNCECFDCGKFSGILFGCKNTIYLGCYSSIISSCNSCICGVQFPSANPAEFSTIIAGRGNKLGGDGFFPLRPRSNTIIGGASSSIIGSYCSAIISGYTNTSLGSNLSLILGGQNNYVRNSLGSIIVGGLGNRISIQGGSNLGSLVFGGLCNFICNSDCSSIIGGSRNGITASGVTFVLGGCTNCVQSGTSSVSIGGRDNLIKQSNYSLITGRCNYIGYSNCSIILGGCGNTASCGVQSILIGGCNNLINRDNNGPDMNSNSIIGGRNNRLYTSGYETNNSFILSSINSRVRDSGVSSIINSYSSFINIATGSSIISSKFSCIERSSSDIIIGGLYNSIEFNYFLDGKANSLVGGFCNCLSTFGVNPVNQTFYGLASFYSSIIGGTDSRIYFSLSSGIFGGHQNIIAGCNSLIDFPAKNNSIISGSCNLIRSGNSGTDNSVIIGGFQNCICMQQVQSF